MPRDLLPGFKSREEGQQNLLSQESPEQEATAMADVSLKKSYSKMPDWLRKALIELSKNKKIAGLAKQVEPVSEGINKAFEKSGIPEFINPIGSTALGAAQGIGQMGTSVLNTPAYLKELATGQEQERLKFPDLSKYAGEGALSRLGFGAGELAGPLAIPFGAALKAPSYASKVGSGALAGFLTGEDESGSRAASTVIGGALPGTLEVAKDVAKLGKRAIAKDVIKTKQMLTKKYNKGYEGFKNQIEERGLNEPNLRPLEYDQTELNPWLTKEAKHAIMEFNKNPTINQAHELQSDLGKTISELESSAKDFISKQRLKEVKELRTSIKDQMMNKLHKTGNIDLAIEYNDLSQGFKQELAPYLKPYIKQLEKDIANGDSPSEAINKMLKDSSFLKSVKGTHEGLSNRAALKKIWELIYPIKSMAGK